MSGLQSRFVFCSVLDHECMMPTSVVSAAAAAVCLLKRRKPLCRSRRDASVLGV